ncbi:MAG: tetratricopeptide repeat protein, partial [Chitinophagaceae bacterium]
VEAKTLMDDALPMGSMIELHQYGRQLLGMKQAQEALKVFKTNYDKNPDQFTTNVGLGRGYSANGEYKKALEHMKAALTQAPDDLNKNSVAAMIKKLEAGKDVN